MTDGTSQGLFIVVAIVIFGIFVVLAYILFEDTLSPAMASMFSDVGEKSLVALTEVNYDGKNLLKNGHILKEGPKEGSDGNPLHGGVVGGREFLKYTDVSPIFNTFGVGTYTVSFDMKATVPGTIKVYTSQSHFQYFLHDEVDVLVPDKWVRYSIVVDVYEMPKDFAGYSEYSNLSFYGIYGTRRSPSVKNMKIEKGAVEGIPKFVHASKGITYSVRE